MSHRLFIRTIPSLMVASLALPAAERTLSYTYDSNVLAPEQSEVEVWGTFRTGRDTYYKAFDHRLELEYGVAENIQTAVYFNFSSETSDPTGLGATQRDRVNGMSWEWKFKLSDSAADALGSALYFEPEISGKEIGLELKGIIDKRIDRELIAFNVTIEPEWEFNPDTTKPEFKAELNLGWSHLIEGGYAFGIEGRSVSKIVYVDGADDAKWDLEQSVIYAGPAVHLVKNGFWTTITVMPQLFAPKARSGNSHANRERLGAEDLEVRALIGLHF